MNKVIETHFNKQTKRFILKFSPGDPTEIDFDFNFDNLTVKEVADKLKQAASDIDILYNENE
jgi:hypothetical protein